MPGNSPVPRSFAPTAVTARQREVLRLRALGTPVPEIARQLGGVTESAVWKLLKRALAAQAAELRSMEAFELALALQMMRYELLLSKWFPRAMSLDKDAADVALKIMSQIADVNGFKSLRIVPGQGRTGEPPIAPQTLVTAVLERLEQLSDRFAVSAPAIEAGQSETEEVQLP